MVSYDHEICDGNIANFQKFVVIFSGEKKCKLGIGTSN